MQAKLLRALACVLLLGACAAGDDAGAGDERSAPSTTHLPADPIGGELFPLLPQRSVGEPLALGGLVALVRWWTDGCPYCERSLPALDALRARHEERGLVALGVYHPKPPRAVSDDEVRSAARAVGWNGALLVDEDWSALHAAWLDGAARDATSVTFLVDRHGRVRFVHPGPELHPSDDPAHAACDADFRALESALIALLAEGG